MRGRAQGGFRWVIAALAALLCVPPIAHADLPAGSFVFDGDVKALTRDSDGSTYLGGSFTHEYAPVGGGVMVNRFDGGPSAFPQVAGTVYATISDGHGGWFVGGGFRSVGREKRLHIAAIDVPNAALLDWSVELDRTVTALAASPTTVYIGGEFREPAEHLAAVDATTGESRNWAVGTDARPTVTPPPAVASAPQGEIKASAQTHKPSRTIAIPFTGGYKIGNVRRLERRSARLDKHCRYKVTFKPTRTSVGTAKQVTVVAHLGATTDRFPVKVSPL